MRVPPSGMCVLANSTLAAAPAAGAGLHPTLPQLPGRLRRRCRSLRGMDDARTCFSLRASMLMGLFGPARGRTAPDRRQYKWRSRFYEKGRHSCRLPPAAPFCDAAVAVESAFSVQIDASTASQAQGGWRFRPLQQHATATARIAAAASAGPNLLANTAAAPAVSTVVTAAPAVPLPRMSLPCAPMTTVREASSRP